MFIPMEDGIAERIIFLNKLINFKKIHLKVGPVDEHLRIFNFFESNIRKIFTRYMIYVTAL